MIPALLHGKLTREQENMEDILTSTVFGILKYLPPERGLLPFLRRAEIVGGGHNPLDAVGEGARVEYLFWPQIKEQTLEGETEIECHFCEPDLLLTIRRSDSSQMNVLIEAKLWSGKSSGPSEQDDAPYDQLAREWDNLVYLSRRENAEPLLIYLTADFSAPADQIRESELEYRRKRAGSPFACGWLTWRCIPTLFRDDLDEPLQDLVRLCERLNLRFFDGVLTIKSLPEIGWRFRRGAMQFEWSIQLGSDCSLDARFLLVFGPIGS